MSTDTCSPAQGVKGFWLEGLTARGMRDRRIAFGAAYSKASICTHDPHENHKDPQLPLLCPGVLRLKRCTVLLRLGDDNMDLQPASLNTKSYSRKNPGAGLQTWKLSPTTQPRWQNSGRTLGSSVGERGAGSDLTRSLSLGLNSGFRAFATASEAVPFQ